MAPNPLLQLTSVSLTYGDNPLFEDLSLVIQPGDRLALVGRNGSGKSTLMKIMAGLVEPDHGAIVTATGVSVGYMEQDPDLEQFDTLGAFATQDLAPGEDYRIARVAKGLKLDLLKATSTASGGERRRAALARLLAAEPSLMLLDEPTNHLDIQAISWLEAELRQTRAGYVLISHDRAFLRNLTRATLWVDRGVVRRLDSGFSAFEDWRDKTWEEEDLARHKLDRKIKAESRWAVEGISARRKRNQGRVRALQDLRAERAGQIRRQGTAAMAFEAGKASGRKVIEAKSISKTYGERTLLEPLDLTIMRGDRVALVGPNGAGKTTLARMLIGLEAPDQGEVRLGTQLDIAWFDQNRAQLDPDLSLWENLTETPGLSVKGGADQIMVRGTPRHVVGYLKDFLFDEARARAPARALSGGEKARLLLARLMARESNLLVLDEPTNDLDVETLDLLQDLLDRYEGTVILVSHDRDFIDRVATTTIVLDGTGSAVVHAGGWSDIEAPFMTSPNETRKSKPKAEAKPSQKQQSSGLSFVEKHRLDALPAEIDKLSAEIGKLTELLGDPDLYSREPVKFRKATEALAERQEKQAAAEEEWLALAEKAEG